MKNIEDLLKACPRPDVEVPQFKAQLQRRIQDKMEAHLQMNRSFAAPFVFVSLLGMVVALTAVLVLFILKPELPGRINGWVTDVSQPTNVQYKASSILGLPAVLSPEKDKAFAQQWVNQQFPQASNRVKGIEDEKLVTLRWIRLDNGQRVLVMSEIDPYQMEKPLKITNQQTGGIL